MHRIFARTRYVFNFSKIRNISCFLTIIFFSCPLPAFSEFYDSEFYSEKAEDLIKKAEQLKLYEDPCWKTLMHYKPAPFHKYKSLVDDPDFFCAKNGKTNPRAELNATIKAFFEPIPNRFKIIWSNMYEFPF